MKRRKFAQCSGLLAGLAVVPATGWASALPMARRFVGESRFHSIVAKALREGWAELPIGERMAKFGRELHGLPYKSFTLEIDDRIEAPSANFTGLDCWTFFEISLGLSRMIAQPKPSYEPENLLSEIQWTRYRGGQCTGRYLERIHYLAEWYFDNVARGTIQDITRDLGGARKITGRKCQEMTILWKSYRYLRENPGLREPMAAIEKAVSRLPVYYLPEDRVAAVEPKLKNGDILGIVTRHQGGFCSHVGFAYRTNDGVMRLMHASSQKKYRRVIIDKSVSGYLKQYSGSIGIIVGRPLEIEHTVGDPAAYRANLRKLTGGRGMVPLEQP